jgi:replicative DNA helicase
MGIEEGLIFQKKAVERSFQGFEKNLKSPAQLPGADIGIHDLNMAIGGHMRKKLTTIAGRSGMGKTALTIPMFDAGNRVVSGRRPHYLFLTWEMPCEEVVERYISYKTGYSWRMLFQATSLLGEDKIGMIKKYYNEAMNLPVVYQEMSTSLDKIYEMSAWFADKCDKAGKRDGIEVVPVMLIDYVGMAKFTGSNDLKTYKITEFMHGLKGLAKQDGSHVIALAQISRAADSKALPGRDDLSDSVGIEQASDNLGILHRPEYMGQDVIPINGGIPSKDKAMFRLMKGRAFGTGDMVMNCDIKCNRFWNEDHAFEYNYWEQYAQKEFWRQTFGL